ncbi:MAG: S8 family serine peptidase [Bacteroidales bacterium]|nr:S8 family serine peptidase [Bacteroidales bacterium]
MKIFKKAFWLILLFFAGIGLSKGQTVDPNTIDGEVYFQLKASAPIIQGNEKGVLAINQVAFLDSLKNTYAITQVERPFYRANDSKLQRIYLLHFKDIHAVDSVINALKKDSTVAYAEKAPLFRIFYTPNDPDYNSLTAYKWYLNVIQADRAWDIQKGDSAIKIAMIDNAIDVNHPDLKNKIAAEIDLADGDSNPSPPKQTIDWSHGTHTSGLAGAETDNGIGIASIGFNVKLLAIKIAPDTSDGTRMYYGYQGIVWAADHGAKVMNMSWGGPGYYQTGQDVVNYAYNKGCVLVASAGNDGNSDVTYPAGYNHVIAVAATNSDDTKASFSQYGSFVDVCAPGGSDAQGKGIFSCVDYATADYGYMEGTSMSSPIVAGLCGLMLSEDSLLTPEKLEAILKATCDNIDAENLNYVGELGAGRVNAYKALLAVKDTLANQTVVANFQASSVSVPEGGDVNFTDKSTGNITSWNWKFEGGTPSTSTQQNPINILYSNPGTYQVNLTVSDGTHSNTETKTNYVVVYPLISGAWLPQATGFTAQSRGIDHICIVNPSIVWANAYDGSGQGANILEFTKTTNGGNTWTPGTYTGVPVTCTVSDIYAISSQQAWIATYLNSASAPTSNQGIYVTTDGGSTWIKQSTADFSNSSSFPDGVYFWNANDGLCFGDPVSSYFQIYTTTNGGTTWNAVPSTNIPIAFSGEYGYTALHSAYGDSTLWFGTNKGRVFKTTDMGHHWTVSSTGMTEVSTLGFHNDSVGVATYVATDNTGNISDSAMVKTTDGGATWTKVTTTDQYFKSDVAVVPNAKGMLVTTGISQDLAKNGSSYSLDEGNTWTQLDDSVQYTTVKFYSSSVGWAGGFNENSTSRGIWKWLGIPTTGVTELPVNGINIKVYPNPSAGLVHFYLPDNEIVSGITIYDLDGKLVSRLENNQGSSVQDYVMDLRNLTKGVYVAVVKTKKGISKIKLVLQ